MKRLMILLLSLTTVFAMMAGAFAEDKPVQDTDKEQKQEKKVDPTYMLLGLQVPFFYYLSDQKSTINTGLLFKAPAGNDFGVELAFNKIMVPIKEYSVGGVDYRGAGEENFLNYRLDLLYYFQFFRQFQVKFGFDYYQYQDGFINHTLGGSNYAGFGVDCGTTYVLCKRCVGDQYGINIGLNLDVPIYKDFYAISSLGYRYILSDNDALNAGIIDFTLGIGYRIR